MYGLFRCKHGSLGCWYFIQLRQNDYSGWWKIELETKWSKPELMPELRLLIDKLEVLNTIMLWSNSIRLIDQNQNMVGIVSLDRAIPNAEYAGLDLKMSQIKGSYV
ncbi:hypothetical protein P8452_22701 [Trifolium repens]|nr:hypothetical protein P8452_22701 [Trifolium repens]